MSNLAIVTVAAGSAAVVNLAYNMVVARTLGPRAYSEFATSLAIATMLAYAGGALAPITAHLSARYMAAGEPQKIRGVVSVLLRRLMPILALGGLATVILAPSVARVLHFESALSLYVAYGVLASLLLVSIVRSASRGAQQFRSFGVGLFAESTVRLVCGTAMVAGWPHPAMALGGYVAALASTFAWTLIGLRRLSSKVTAAPRLDVTRLLGPTTVLVVAMGTFQSLDMLVVRRFFSAQDAGIYAAAVSFARWIALVAVPFEALLLPQLTFIGERGESTSSTAIRLGAWFMALSGVLMLCFAAIPELIVKVLYGAEYEAAAPLMYSLGVAVFMQYACYLTVQVLVLRREVWPLVPFAVAGILETLIIVLRHDSLLAVAVVLAAMRAVALVAILIGIWIASRRVAIAPEL